jgi:hypothetical protein
MTTGFAKVSNAWRWRRGLIVPSLFAIVSISGAARAQSGEDVSMAEALFQEGRRLMTAGKYAEACPKFEASVRIQSALGALYQLADCQEKTGLTASAWANFLQVAAIARRTNQGERERAARARADSLEPRLSKLVIQVAPGADSQSFSITRDGKTIDRAALGLAVPIDPGEHLVTASAERKKTWSQKVDVTREGVTVKITVPALEEDRAMPSTPTVTPAPAPTAAPPASAPPPHPARPASVHDTEADVGSGQRTIALVAGGLGVASVVFGTVLGLQAKSNWDDAKSECPTKTNCPAGAVSASEDADSQATIANIAFAVGAVGVGTGAVLWFTAPPTGSGVSGFGFSVRGRL